MIDVILIYVIIFSYCVSYLKISQYYVNIALLLYYIYILIM